MCERNLSEATNVISSRKPRKAEYQLLPSKFLMLYQQCQHCQCAKLSSFLLTFTLATCFETSLVGVSPISMPFASLNAHQHSGSEHADEAMAWGRRSALPHFPPTARSDDRWFGARHRSHCFSTLGQVTSYHTVWWGFLQKSLKSS